MTHLRIVPHDRFWRLYEGDELLVTAVYKKGALRVAESIKELAPGTNTEMPPKRSHVEQVVESRSGIYDRIR
jgi:hypothetical protein